MYVYEFNGHIFTETALREEMEDAWEDCMGEEYGVNAFLSLLSPELKKRIKEEVIKNMLADRVMFVDRKELIE